MSAFRRLSPEEMDHHRDRAASALQSMPSEAVSTIADWWNQWYLRAGHKRLGRLLRTEASSRDQRPTAGPKQATHYSSELRARTVSSGVKCSYTEAPLDTPAMFSVQTRGGEVRVVLNTSHPAHSYLKAALDQSNSHQLNASKSSVGNSGEGVRLLIEAWARYEDEQPTGPLRSRAQDARLDWGRVAREQLNDRELGIE